MSSTFATIQSLSNERQQLWRKAGKQKLTESQRELMREIYHRLERLWHQHRCEIVRPNRRFIEDRLRSDVFCDFVERIRHSPSGDALDDDWEEMQHIQPIIVPEKPRKGARLPVYATDEPVTVEFMLSVLRDVTAELRAEDARLAV